jgi:hypothetical protein
MNKAELQQQLAAIEQDAEVIKQQLKMTFPSLQEANPGEMLEDGCVVIKKYDNAVLIAAPKETEIYCTWSKEFSDVFDTLKAHGFIPSDWFIPSAKQLKLAFTNAKQHFLGADYWSSTVANSTNASYVYFYGGFEYISSKVFSNCVRAFRLVEL